MFPFSSDHILVWSLRLCAGAATSVLFLVCVFLIAQSWPALTHVGLFRFFSDDSWHPSGLSAQFNLLPILWGTLIVTAGSVLIATPLAIISAIYCLYYAPPAIARVYRRLVELLAGIPSVVYGLWGLVVLVPMIRELHPPGPSLLAGIIILTLMIFPTIALMAQAAMANVPQQYLRSAAALGLSRWSTIVGVILPTAKPGLITGVILGTGRAIGETMAILMVCGNVVQTPSSLFDPIRTLTANIALEMAYALDDHRSALFASGLLLLIMIIVLAAIAETLRPRGEANV